MHVILMLVLAGLMVSGCISVVFACVTKDVQGAFGIGGYCVAVQAVWVSAMFFKWSQV